MTEHILAGMLGWFIGVLFMVALFYFVGRKEDKPSKYIEEEDDEDDSLEDRSPFQLGESVHVGNPYIQEFMFYVDEERCKPKAFVVEKAVYDMSEEVFRYKLEGLPGYYSQGWLQPNMFGTEVKEYPHLEEAEEVDESETSHDYSRQVAYAVEESQIDRALDILNSDVATESDKQSARKYLRGESE